MGSSVVNALSSWLEVEITGALFISNKKMSADFEESSTAPRLREQSHLADMTIATTDFISTNTVGTTQWSQPFS